MPETNGHQDNLSRLDRIELAIEHVINEHEKLVDEQGRLLKAQINMVDSIDKLTVTVDKLSATVERDHREFHERLNRLENRQ
jgi:hypothetical protein